MAEGFVSLADALRATPVELRVTPPAAPPTAADEPKAAPFAFARDVALARVAALEAYERAVPRLLEALARDVLARELVSAPPDLCALARALAEDFASDDPVAFVVAREDASRFPSGLRVRVDPRLRAGDIVMEVRDGEIDARFALRVRDAIESAAP